MNPVTIIARKRDGATLTAAEITSLVAGYVSGAIPDYQMSAFAMAVYLRGMDTSETAVLTEAMLRSGDVLEASDISRRVDKHSTGGIGDKSSLPLAPLLACCGLQVPMISGRGLGATGGTLDKLESIPGFRVNLSVDEVQRIVDQIGCVITAATENLVPADRKLYALRDVTATVASIPLITASIMSKKLAENLSALVLDVKFGSGAFMKSPAAAAELARSLVDTGARMGVPTTALLTDMNQPNGRLAGNAVEVDEAIEILQGGGPADLREVTLALATELLLLKKLATTTEQARTHLVKHLDSGAAYERFRLMVAAQGGDLDAPRPRAAALVVTAPRAGYVAGMDTERLGMVIVDLGGGRKKLGQAVDHAVGLEMLVRVGDRVERGQPLARLFAHAADHDWARLRVNEAIRVEDGPCAPLQLIVDRIGPEIR